MKTRMDKYYKEDSLEESRTMRNKEKYSDITESDLEKLDLTSNISILGANADSLDIEKLKKILDEKYSKNEKKVYLSEEDENSLENEDTKEYDLNKILEEAHKNKNDDYDAVRFKKLRETQYEILNNLDLSRKEEPEVEEALTVEEANLMNLIKTVNENSLKRGKNLDLMSDLKGDEYTEVLDPIVEDDYTSKKPSLVEELEKTIKLSKNEIVEELDNTHDDMSLEEDETGEGDAKADTFYTGKFQIKESDLDDFDDLQKEMKTGNAFIRILIAIMILIILGIVVFFVDKYMNLGLFK